MLDKTTEQALRAKAAKLRCLTIDTIYHAQSGHPAALFPWRILWRFFTFTSFGWTPAARTT